MFATAPLFSENDAATNIDDAELQRIVRETADARLEELIQNDWKEVKREEFSELANTLIAKFNRTLDATRNVDYTLVSSELIDQLDTAVSSCNVRSSRVIVLFGSNRRVKAAIAIRRLVASTRYLVSLVPRYEAHPLPAYRRCIPHTDILLLKGDSYFHFPYPSMRVVHDKSDPDHPTLWPVDACHSTEYPDDAIIPVENMMVEQLNEEEERRNAILLSLASPWKRTGTDPNHTGMSMFKDPEAWRKNQPPMAFEVRAAQHDGGLQIITVAGQDKDNVAVQHMTFDIELGLPVRHYATIPTKPWTTTETTTEYIGVVDHGGATIYLPSSQRVVVNPDILPSLASTNEPNMSNASEFYYTYHSVNDPAYDHEDAFTFDWLTKQMSVRITQMVPATDVEKQEFGAGKSAGQFYITREGMYIGPRTKVFGPALNDFGFLQRWEQENRQILTERGWEIHPSQLVPYADLARLEGNPMPGDTAADLKKVRDVYHQFDQMLEEQKRLARENATSEE